MKEREGAATFQGNPLTLVGHEIEPGHAAPDVTLLDNELNLVSIAQFKGSVVILCSVPSLDTPVCEMETRRFNHEAAGLGPDVKIVTVSMDLPFAQKRWCGAVGVDSVITLSDHYEAQFGIEYGVLIKELRLLARSVFILDREGVIRYVQHVKEISEEPDYEAVLKAARDLA